MKRQTRQNESVSPSVRRGGLASSSTRRSGFTLIELMIGMGLFSIVMTVVISIFVSSLRSSRFISLQASAVDNLSLSVEQIAREVRTGFGFSAGSGTLSYTNDDGEAVSYAFTNGRIIKNGVPLTDERIKVTGSFLVNDFGGTTTPRITITAKATDERNRTLANIQTSVSARLIYYKMP